MESVSEIVEKESRKIAERYERTAKDNDKWTMGYGSGTQEACFQFVVNKIDLEGKRILDVACGRGDFKGFLDDHGVRCASYVGVDGSSSLVRQGRKKHKKIDLRRIVWPLPSPKQYVDLLKQSFNTVVIIGIIYELGMEAATSWLKVAYSLVDESIVVDWLGSFHEEMLEICRTIGPTESLGGVSGHFWVQIKKE